MVGGSSSPLASATIDTFSNETMFVTGFTAIPRGRPIFSRDSDAFSGKPRDEDPLANPAYLTRIQWRRP